MGLLSRIRWMGRGRLRSWPQLRAVVVRSDCNQQPKQPQTQTKTPNSTNYRASSALSVYFDAIEAGLPTSRTPSGAGSSPGASPAASPRAGGRLGSGSGSFDATMPRELMQPSALFSYHQGSKLAAVPSGDLGGAEGGQQPRCCVIS